MIKTAVRHQAKDARLERGFLKAHKKMEVVVRVAWAGICGSDLHKSL